MEEILRSEGFTLNRNGIYYLAYYGKEMFITLKKDYIRYCTDYAMHCFGYGGIIQAVPSILQRLIRRFKEIKEKMSTIKRKRYEQNYGLYSKDARTRNRCS